MARFRWNTQGTQSSGSCRRAGLSRMAGLIVAESAIFTIFVAAYLYYLGRDVPGPTPREVLEIPIFGTVCLLSSSGFIMLAERAIEHGKMAAFTVWWAVTILLGAIFLVDTANEWYKLIVHDHLTISTNLFGTTLLLACGTACLARDRWPHHDAGGAGLCIGREAAPRACGTRESAGHVLALCRCGVGGCFQVVYIVGR